MVVALVLVTSSCAWSGPYGDSGRTNHNPLGGLDPTTVSGLRELWSPSQNSFAFSTLDYEHAITTENPSLVEPGYLKAYSASGTSGCGGTPRVCEPVWIASLPTDPITRAGDYVDIGSPVLVDGFVAVTFRSGGTWRVSLYDRHGREGCSTATPRVCSDLGHADLFATGLSPPSLTAGGGAVYAVGWLGSSVADIAALHLDDLIGCSDNSSCAPFMRATTDGVAFAPAYAGGRLYVRSQSGVVVFDGAGLEGCTNGDCAPLWSYDVGVVNGAWPAIAVAYGRVIANVNGVARVFDASGVAGCSGTPRRCQALWTSDTEPAGFVGTATPIVTKQSVIVSRAVGFATEVAAYDLDAGPTCSGAPVVCSPRWHVAMPMAPVALIGSDNVGFAGGMFGGGNRPVFAFRLDGVGCDPITHACPVISTISPPQPAVPTAVANGRVLFQYAGFPARMYSVLSVLGSSTG